MARPEGRKQTGWSVFFQITNLLKSLGALTKVFHFQPKNTDVFLRFSFTFGFLVLFLDTMIEQRLKIHHFVAVRRQPQMALCEQVNLRSKLCCCMKDRNPEEGFLPTHARSCNWFRSHVYTHRVHIQTLSQST